MARLNEMIRDRLVCGISNERWQQKLLAEKNLTYDKAYKLLLSLEASEKEVKDITSSTGSMLVRVLFLRHCSSFILLRCGFILNDSILLYSLTPTLLFY